MDHPSEEILKRFAAGTASREESRAVVAHLIKGCALCSTRLRRLMEHPAVSAGLHEVALERFDQEMTRSLESAISPVQTLREVLKVVQPRMKEESPAKKKE
jgi:hypothetical protein